jgi:hypothetical protein
MSVRQFRKELEELKKEIKKDKSNLGPIRIEYLFLQMDGDDKRISELLKGLTDKEKALVTIDKQPEYIQYEKAVKEGNVNQAIEILDPLSKRVRDEIIKHHDEDLRFDTYLTNMSNDLDYTEQWDDFNERFKTTNEYKWIQEVKESF